MSKAATSASTACLSNSRIAPCSGAAFKSDLCLPDQRFSPARHPFKKPETDPEFLNCSFGSRPIRWYPRVIKVPAKSLESRQEKIISRTIVPPTTAQPTPVHSSRRGFPSPVTRRHTPFLAHAKRISCAQDLPKSLWESGKQTSKRSDGDTIPQLQPSAC